jgi:hypothetical protein
MLQIRKGDTANQLSDSARRFAKHQLSRVTATNPKGGAMRKLGIAVLVVFACFLTSAADAQGVCASVHLGGADINWSGDGESAPPNNDANFSLGAIERCDGTVMGQVQDTWAGLGPVHGTISCLVVDGNNAWVSGIISHSNTADDFDYAGQGFLIRLQDNGMNNQNDPPDMASFMFIGDPGFFEFSCYGMFGDDSGVNLFDLNNGQLTIN